MNVKINYDYELQHEKPMEQVFESVITPKYINPTMKLISPAVKFAKKPSSKILHCPRVTRYCQEFLVLL